MVIALSDNAYGLKSSSFVKAGDLWITGSSSDSLIFSNSHHLHSYLKYKNPNDYGKGFTLAKAA